MSSRRTASLATIFTALAGLISARRRIRRVVPSWTGTITCELLSDDVEILRDKVGTPAIFARCEDDMFAAQGYIHAADRLFQMDAYARFGLGEVAQVMGPAALEGDRLMRRLGLGASARGDLQLLSGASTRALERFADGVNAWIEDNQRRLPIEFSLMKYRPMPWTPERSLVLPRLLSYGLSGNWQAELVRAQLAERFGTDVLALLDDSQAGDAAFAPQIAANDLAALSEAIRTTRDSMLRPGNGSNAWAIAPWRSGSGGALLASDPHLDLSLPGTWYEQVMTCDSWTVRGFTMPGLPGILVGHNTSIAWTFTNSTADVQDLAIEQIDTEAGTWQDENGNPNPLSVRTERIQVRFSDDDVLVVRSTPRGPLISGPADDTRGQSLSLQWAGIGPNRSFDTIYGLLRANDTDSFRAAMRHWTSPSLNAIYADASGVIGHQLVGEIPVRADGTGAMPRDATDPSTRWLGTIPFEQLPYVFEPPGGIVVSANDRIVDDSYPHFISREWMNGYRGARIRALLETTELHTVEQQVRIQCDVASLPAARFCASLALHDIRPGTSPGTRVLELLTGWDHQLREGSVAAAAWRLTLRAVQEEAYGFLGDMLLLYLGYNRQGINGNWSLMGKTTPRLLDAIEQDDAALLQLGQQIADRPGQQSGEWSPSASWGELLSRALDRAGAYLEAGTRPPRYGAPRDAKRPFTRKRHPDAWGAIHAARWAHPLGAIPLMGSRLARGPIAMPGDHDTVWQASSYNNPNNDAAMVGPSVRFVIDLQDPDRSVAIMAGGVSGHPGSTHYDDQIEPWSKGMMRTAPCSRTALELTARHRQLMRPTVR